MIYKWEIFIFQEQMNLYKMQLFKLLKIEHNIVKYGKYKIY